MAKAVLEYDLNDPEDKVVHEFAGRGYKYRRVIEKLLSRLPGEPARVSGILVAEAIEKAAREDNLVDIAELAAKTARGLAR